MSEEVLMPALGESVTEGTVTQWLKQVGDTVEVDEPLLEVSTDKVDTEIPSPVAGTVQEIRVQEDETVEVGTVLAVVGSGEAAPAASEEPAQQAEEAPAPAPAEEAPAQEPAPAAQAAPTAAAQETPAPRDPAPAQEAPAAQAAQAPDQPAAQPVSGGPSGNAPPRRKNPPRRPKEPPLPARLERPQPKYRHRPRKPRRPLPRKKLQRRVIQRPPRRPRLRRPPKHRSNLLLSRFPVARPVMSRRWCARWQKKTTLILMGSRAPAWVVGSASKTCRPRLTRRQKLPRLPLPSRPLPLRLRRQRRARQLLPHRCAAQLKR